MHTLSGFLRLGGILFSVLTLVLTIDNVLAKRSFLHYQIPGKKHLAPTAPKKIFLFLVSSVTLLFASSVILSTV